MAKSLETLLRDIAKSGELNYISLIPHASGFAATYSPTTRIGHVFAEDPDPAKAIMMAIKNFRKPGHAEADIEADPEVAELLS